MKKIIDLFLILIKKIFVKLSKNLGIFNNFHTNDHVHSTAIPVGILSIINKFINFVLLLPIVIIITGRRSITWSSLSSWLRNISNIFLVNWFLDLELLFFLFAEINFTLIAYYTHSSLLSNSFLLTISWLNVACDVLRILICY